MMRWMTSIAAIGVLLVSPELYAWSWQDLWVTRDQQAQQLMQEGQFADAAAVFERPDWRATAWYRAGDFKQSAQAFATLNHETGWYNQGNALAYLGEYRQAIEAYDRVLALNPAHQDALHNKAILEKLLKDSEQEQEQDKQGQNKQDQDKQDQGKQDQDKQDQGKQDQDKQDQDKQDQDKQDQDKQDQDKQDQDKQDQDKQDQDKQDQDKQDQDKQDQDKQDQDKQDQDKQDQNESAQQGVQNDQPQEDAEQKEANEQWLRLVPDDPAGLMRQKFLRDHLRRQRGWQP